MPAAKPITDRIAQVKARKDALAAKLSSLEARAKEEARKRDLRRRIIVGGAVLAALETNPRVAAALRRLLDKEVTRPMDRAAVADLLGEAEPASPGAAPGAPSDQTVA